MNKTEQNINFSIPKDYNDKDILLKINSKVTNSKEHKFRSFAIRKEGNVLQIGNKWIAVEHLFNVLKERGLSKSIPMFVSTCPVKFIDFDWNPQAYAGPTVWYFNWNGVECSITGKNNYTYIRIHDLTENLGETILNEITNELLKFWKDPSPPTNYLTIYTTQKTGMGYVWNTMCTKLHRSIDTIYIDEKIKTKLIVQLRKFYDSANMYDRYGVTWKRVHLFHGPSGSGKTSTVLALASIFQKNIFKLTITPTLDSQDIEQLFTSISDKSFLLLEDVDALFVKREGNTSIDFSTILNCMDGLTTKCGLVLFMTTNHITQLDEAFVRPGRVDVTVEFELVGKKQLKEALQVLGSQYAHEHEEFLNKHNTGMSIAALQKHLFDCIMEEKESILL